MRNITIATLFTFFLFFSTFVSSQSLFKRHLNEHVEQLNIQTDLYDIDKKNLIIFLDLNQVYFYRIMNEESKNLQIDLPFLSDSILELEQFSVFSNSIHVTRHTSNGTINESYVPAIKTYRIINSDEDISGSFIFTNKGVKAIIQKNDNIYQIDKIKLSNITDEETYVLMNINAGQVGFDFKCAHDELAMTEELNPINYKIHQSDLSCIEMAIEIDYYTFQSFQNFEDAIDWSLAMVAVVNELFQGELFVGLTSNTVQIWEYEDPYFSFIDDPQNMLIAIRENWINNEVFSNIDRDVAHLFSKRSNTGTGGIAFLNGIGSLWNGYGFSSNLTDENDYLDLPVPYFFWNIYCLAHELGHNLGAKHTQWCGWPGGPIDNCTNIEEISPGECEDYINNPSPQLGTIMSYCHTWSFSEGGGIIMKFHETVKYTVLPYIGLQNLTTCDEVFLEGCIDVNACNYNIEAIEDNGSCIYPLDGFDCFGNCLNDVNQDGICDDSLIIDDNLYLSVFCHPNPADDYLQIKFNNNSFEDGSLYIFNNIGQLVWSQKVSVYNSKINISSFPTGLYSAHFVGNDARIIQNLIIN